MHPPSPHESYRPLLWRAAIIVAATLAAYHNSFSVPFVFDDVLAIVENPTLRQLWPPWGSFSPPSGQGLTVEGRPLLNVSFALNYALGGVSPQGYHVVNLVIHLFAALVLFGVVRRSLAALN